MAKLEAIYSTDDRFKGVIASLASPVEPFRDVAQPDVTFTIANIPTLRYFWDAVVEFTTTPPKANLIRETIIKQIDRLSDDPSAYEEGERAPDNATKEGAKQLIHEIYPTALLSGADVYAYYGEVNISWEVQQRKVKLIVPPLDSHQPAVIYHGRMNKGSVVESALEPMSTAKTLAGWLTWLQG